LLPDNVRSDYGVPSIVTCVRAGLAIAEPSASLRRRIGLEATTTAGLFGQVFLLVSAALASAAVGTYLGRYLPTMTARICSFCGLGMLLIASFGGERFRTGWFAITWLYSLALLIGLGLGPVIGYLATINQQALTEAAGGSALTVLGMGAAGFALNKDLARWMRPLSLVVLACVVVSLVLLLFRVHTYPWVSLIVFAASSGLIAVNVSYLRRHRAEVRPVPLATGVFISIVNIFVSLLNLFSSD
jgi:modulator of FtsH protease